MTMIRLAIYSVIVCSIFECLTIVLTWIKTLPTVRQLKLMETEFAPSFSCTIAQNCEILTLISPDSSTPY